MILKVLRFSGGGIARQHTVRLAAALNHPLPRAALQQPALLVPPPQLGGRAFVELSGALLERKLFRHHAVDAVQYRNIRASCTWFSYRLGGLACSFLL